MFEKQKMRTCQKKSLKAVNIKNCQLLLFFDVNIALFFSRLPRASKCLFSANYYFYHQKYSDASASAS